jgi:Ca2+-binding RTX toxin-like protein
MLPLNWLRRLTSRKSRRGLPARFRPEVVALEDRTVPSAITWANRGQASDGFAAAFGPNAEAARRVVDAAIAAWSGPIFNFNYAPGTGPANTFTLDVKAVDLGPGAGFGFTHDRNGNGRIDAAEVDGFGKPHQGTLSLATISNWFVDPSPLDNGEFLGRIRNAFSGDGSGPGLTGKVDLFSHAVAGLSHLLGLASTAGLPGNELRLQTGGLLTPTGQADATAAGATLWSFRGPTVEALLTDDNGLATRNGRPQYVARPGNAVNGFFGADDSSNSQLDDPTRYLPSNLAVRILGDAYGYTVGDPEFSGTFYAMKVGSTLVVRGGEGPSNDSVRIESGGFDSLVASVDVSPDVPGTGPTDAFVSNFLLTDVTSITIKTGDGYDRVELKSGGLATSVAIDTGGGDDTILLYPSDSNLDRFRGSITVNGNTGLDSLFLDDSGKTAPANYTVSPAGVQGLAATLTLGGIENFSLSAAQSSNLIRLQGAFAKLAVYANGGDDKVSLETPAGGPSRQVTIDGGPGADTLFSLTSDNDWVLDSQFRFDLAVRRAYFVPFGALTRKAETTGFVEVESVIGGDFRDRFTVRPGALITSVSANGGFDTLDYAAFTTPVVVNLATGSATDVGGGLAGNVAGIEAVLGGSAGDELRGDGQANVLVGNGGNDQLFGGDGADILVGGLGSDTIHGDGGDDILIGGRTDHDAADATLAALSRGWSDASLGYNQRVANLRAGTGPNAPFRLDRTTVHDDTETGDHLFGDAGADWFIIFPADFVHDQATGEATN